LCCVGCDWVSSSLPLCWVECACSSCWSCLPYFPHHGTK
jgi:hypothetical protein